MAKLRIQLLPVCYTYKVRLERGKRDFWIGGRKLRGTWMWDSSHTSLQYYTNWGSGEPNDRYSEESCIEMYHHDNYQWNDEACYEHNYFICEQPYIHGPYVPVVPTTTKLWFTWQIVTDKPYVPPTTATTTSTTTSTTTTTTPVPPTTKHLQMVTLPHSPQNSQHTSCQSDWIRFDTSCYLFAKDITYDWVESGHFCSLFGASLASIETEMENNFIRQHLLNIGRPVDFWVGGTDIVTEGDWKWITSQKPVMYSDWYPGKPSDFHHNVNCLELLHNYQYHWNDQDCHVVNHFICEMP
ncbi:macrophage mannose receptor 1-like [Saccostrea echinata]|uniref:macrophage mannose receptor 1-like n=1 Tax=Saccostrea echinata TaxID=191078 RepID=UPI002A82B47E|nr:macrophage mannose receptor 1-like [Saccostrea echinata]